MNVVFLSPHFPPNFRHFVRGLRDAGATVLGLGDEPFDNMPGELRAQFHEYYRVGNMEHYDDLLHNNTIKSIDTICAALMEKYMGCWQLLMPV